MTGAADVVRLAAFAEEEGGGNPAGVLVSDEHPPEGEMQAIAAEVGYSETAFLRPRPESEDGIPRWRVRYFSPTAEVPFCGHATIAAGVLLAEEHGAGRMLFQLNRATVPVETGELDGRQVATLVSPAVSVGPVDDRDLDEALTWLRWSRDDLDPDMPPAEADAGSGHLILPLRERYILSDLRYDHDRLARLCREHGWVTVHCVWRATARVFHARDAAPAIGVVEDPATGAAAAAFGGYLREHGLLDPPARFRIHQGDDMGRPSVLRVELPEDDPGVRVSGAVRRL